MTPVQIPASVLIEPLCVTVQVSAFGEFEGPAGHATDVEVTIGHRTSGDSTASETFILIDGRSVERVERAHPLGAELAFTSPIALRALHEVLGRVIVDAERHGVLPVPPSMVEAPADAPAVAA